MRKQGGQWLRRGRDEAKARSEGQFEGRELSEAGTRAGGPDLDEVRDKLARSDAKAWGRPQRPSEAARATATVSRTSRLL